VKTNCTVDESTAIVTYVGDPKGVVAINKDGEREECVFSENTATVTYTLYIKYTRTSEDDCVFDVSLVSFELGCLLQGVRYL
jgi:hypothetical protein